MLADVNGGPAEWCNTRPTLTTHWSSSAWLSPAYTPTRPRHSPPALALPAAGNWGTSPVIVAEPDPHPAWHAEWRALVDLYNAPGSGFGDDGPQYRRILELEKLAAETPARTVAGAAAQVRFARAFIEQYGGLGDGVNDEAMLDKAIATLDRLAGEAGYV